MITNIAKAATVVFVIMALTWIAIHVFAQQTLVTLRVRVDEINYEQTGPILAPSADEFRTALIKQLQRRGDIEFVSANADFHIRIIINIAQVYCIQGEKPSGYSASVLLVSKVTKETIRLDQTIFTAPTIDGTARDAAEGIEKILGLPRKKEDKPAVINTTTATLER